MDQNLPSTFGRGKRSLVTSSGKKGDNLDLEKSPQQENGGGLEDQLESGEESPP